MKFLQIVSVAATIFSIAAALPANDLKKVKRETCEECEARAVSICESILSSPWPDGYEPCVARKRIHICVFMDGVCSSTPAELEACAACEAKYSCADNCQNDGDPEACFKLCRFKNCVYGEYQCIPGDDSCAECTAYCKNYGSPFDACVSRSCGIGGYC